VISWLYVQYFETGKLNTEFIGGYGNLSGIDIACLRDHRARIQQLRTYCQHNLSFSEDHSRVIQAACEAWFKSECGTHLPSDENHWEKILVSIILEAKTYFENLEKIIRSIEANETFSQILEQWQLRISRFHAPHKFDVVIEKVASDWGRESFDAVKFRKRYYDKWRASFEYRTDQCDFEKEARKLVEQAMLSDQQDVLPIDGTDVMRAFDITPGSRVKEILQLGRELFTANPCSRDQLLAMILERLETKKLEVSLEMMGKP
jgi:hypothetical protein